MKQVLSLLSITQVNKLALLGLLMALASCAGGLDEGKALITGSSQISTANTLKVSTYYDVKCALIIAQGLKCWGKNSNGIMSADTSQHVGDDISEMGSALPLVNLGGSLKQIAVGLTHVCGLLTTGDVKCWGENANGQLGHGNTISKANTTANMGTNLPSTPLGAGTVIKVEASLFNSCVLMLSGGVRCWGINNNGELGLGHTNYIGDAVGETAALTDLPLGGQVLDIGMGISHSCVLISGGTVKCWGANIRGELGLGHSNFIGDDAGEIAALSPINFGTGTQVTALTVGYYHNCVLLDNNQVKCWGENANGQLGYGNTNHIGHDINEMGDNLAAVNLGTNFVVRSLFSGGRRTCALSNNSVLKCWGENLKGQLGLGDVNDRGDNTGEMGDNLPAVNLGTNTGSIQSISMGSSEVCVVFSTQKMKCWGENSFVPLGLGAAAGINVGDATGEMGDNLPYINLGFTLPTSN